MGVVNTTPEGLLDLLQAQTGGKVPNVMAEQLLPTISLKDFYEAHYLSCSANSTTVFKNAQATVTVPAGESWKVISLGASITLPLAADYVEVRVTADRLPRSIIAADTMQLAAFGVTAVAVNQVEHLGGILVQPVVLNSGSRLLFTVPATSMTGPSISFRWAVIRLRT